MNGYAAALQTAPKLLHRYGGPVGAIGRLIGLGQEEVEAGPPWWAWIGIGVVVGAGVVYGIRHKF